jgi:WD40 repeat protein
MSHMLNNVLWVSVLTAVMGPSLRGEEPRGSAGLADPLPAGAVSRFGTARFLNYGRVFSVAFTPDGKTLAAGSWDGEVQLWEVASGKEFRHFAQQQTPVRSVAFSSAGTIMACGGKSSDIVLRDAATAKELRRLTGHKGPISFITFSPDGKVLVSKGYDQTLRLWDVASGRELRRLGHKGRASEVNEPDSPVVFSPDGKTAASATLDAGSFRGDLNFKRTFRLWDVATGAEIRSFKGNATSLGHVAFSPDGKLLAVGATWPALRQGTYIYMWDMDSGTELRPIEWEHVSTVHHEQIPAESPESVSFLTFSPDGKTLASSGGGPFIQLWEVATRRETCRFQTPETGLKSLAFSPDGRLLASGSTDITVFLWDVTARMQGGKLRPAELSPQEFQSLWANLGSEEVPKARRALWSLVAAGDLGVQFLRKHLHPAVSPAGADSIARLVGDLDSAQFPVRTRAMAQLTELGELAEPALHDALKKHPPLELRQRVEQLRNKVVDQRSRPTGDSLRFFRAVEILEQIATPEARQLLETLSRGAPGSLLTREAKASLARLSRRSAA